MALLSFLGAIQQVTGSCYLIETHTPHSVFRKKLDDSVK